MNPHLNLFRFFNDSPEAEFIENNLSRAFAICLKEDPLFFSHYLQSVVQPADFDYLFSTFPRDAGYVVDVQQEMTSVNIDGIKKVYAVAMTAGDLDVANFLNFQVQKEQDHHTTDVWILIKDIALVVEVKRTAEDCRAQLYNQIYPFIENGTRAELVAVSRSWPQVIGIMEKVSNLHKMLDKTNIFVEDFLRLSELRYPHWFPSKPFRNIRFSPDPSSPEYFQMVKRLRQCVLQSRYELLGYTNRFAIAVPFTWANEIQPGFASYDDPHKNYLTLDFWPGNTKGQGYFVYGKPMDWVERDSLNIGGRDYQFEVAYNIKFSHFNRYVSGVTFYSQDLKGPLLHTAENFHAKSGKWYREGWSEFAVFLDGYFKESFDWKGKCQWEDNFLESDRSYFTCSLGFEATLFIPYAELADIDKKEQDIAQVAAKLNDIFDTIKDLI